MMKHVVLNGAGWLLLAMGGSALCAPAVRAQAPDKWRCEIDLHQGNTGRLDFRVTAGNLLGTLTVVGGRNPMASDVRGRLGGETISFTRTLTPSTTVQPFRGVVLASDDGNFKMAGRFAAAFEGVWSATCASHSASDAATGGRGTSGGELAGPALTLRADPAEPRTGQRVRLIADAAHSSGVRDITIHVNGQPVQTCAGTHCQITGGPYPAGRIRWSVSARAQNGGTTEGEERDLVISAGSASGSCSISGAARGPRAASAGTVAVALFGPDNRTSLRVRRPFTGGRFRFADLPDGKYIVSLDAKADIAINPPRREVVCRGGAIDGVNFEFR
jgi:hypothetical protein